MKKKTLIRGFIGIMLLGQVAALSGCSFKGSTGIAYKTDLEVWGVFDDSDAYSTIFTTWEKTDPFVGRMEYRKFSVDTYKQDLLDALASGNGPDIFMIRNSWMPAFADKVVPMPAGLLDVRQYQAQMVDVAVNDNVTADGKIYGIPLSVDSLALFYNKDLFNAAGITQPPTTWEQLQTDAARLTNIDANGNITTSGVSLGGWDKTSSRNGNINRATDVFLAMVCQLGGLKSQNGGLETIDFNGNATRQALAFYSGFSSGRSPSYSWNPTMHQSLDAFSEGHLAMTINYSWQYPVFKRKNAKLNIGVAPLPQFATGGQTVNFANYWTYVVAKNTSNKVIAADKQSQKPSLVTADPVKYNEVRILEAWEFLKFLTFPNNGTVTIVSGGTGATKDVPVSMDPAKDYLTRTQKPAARRDLIELQKSDPILGAFAVGNLIDRSWYQRDPETVEGFLNESLSSLILGEATLFDGLQNLDARLRSFQGERR
jgi:multiple sugar transport system substrate-binding protein